jgi:hypothetical protein
MRRSHGRRNRGGGRAGRDRRRAAGSAICWSGSGAEVGLFLLYRPLVLLVLAAALARRAGSPFRITGYALFLVAAGAGEALPARVLGHPPALAAIVRGMVAGALLAAVLDLLHGAADRARRTLGPRAGDWSRARAAARAGALTPYRALAFEDGEPRPSASPSRS